MYIRKTEKTVKGKTYTNHLLVESVATAKGPRQRTVCSLGDLSPRPASEWLKLAYKVRTPDLWRLFRPTPDSYQTPVWHLHHGRETMGTDMAALRGRMVSGNPMTNRLLSADESNTCLHSRG